MDVSKQPNRFLWPVIFGVYQAVAWCGAFAFVLVYVPRVEKIFRDFHAELPTAAKSVISLNHFLFDYFWLIALCAPLIAGAAFGVALLIEQLPMRGLRWCAYVLMALPPIVFFALAVIALVVPLMQMNLINPAGH